MFSIKEPSRWSGYVILSEETLTDFVRKSFAHCDFADLDDEEKQLNIDKLSKIRQTNEGLIASNDWRGLLPLIENSSQLDWICRQLYQYFDGDFCWPSNVWDKVNARYNELNEETFSPLEVRVEIKIYFVAFSDSGKDEMSLVIQFFPKANTEELIAAIRDEMKNENKKEQNEMERLLKKGSYTGLDETQKGWIDSWLAVKVSQECAQPEILDNLHSVSGDDTVLNCRANITVKCPLNIDDYPFDTNNLRFFLTSLNSLSTNSVTLQPDTDKTDNGFSIGSWANPRGFRIERLTLEANNIPMKKWTLDEGPSSEKSHAIQFGFAITRNPGAVILRTILPGLIIIFTGLVTGLWAWLDPSHSDSVATSVMPGVLIALIALQITAAQSIPQNSGSTRVDKFFLFAYFFVLFMILALIAPQWIGWLFLAMSLGSVAYGIMVMFKNNWRTAFNSLIGKE